ncbi:T9SS type A sorting domain-containing protein, partial [candidate division KSB1 bacterium]|nr:T9SS type A sorting domain-containing protein [candidate division KSB1 bacterium]NIR68405.1 T9SS type A sorting domain-containing protein [candidate division KSB1 bacterium]NIS22479.1 T9SS type A sorting domain-containing protein [candidate division KSB1 bacterium]NIT69327.1 T9SS type A sorting domain-containing protein [candidate division KSB1 bacterium]NIU22984.1 T9SS type A sorting domain-containing protein [candidate division KSB1 bacterium]
NPGTTIRYHLPKQAHVSLEVYNILGQKVVELLDEVQPAGKYEVQWDGKDGSNRLVSSGLYFYRIKTEEFSEVKKMILVR